MQTSASKDGGVATVRELCETRNRVFRILLAVLFVLFLTPTESAQFAYPGVYVPSVCTFDMTGTALRVGVPIVGEETPLAFSFRNPVAFEVGDVITVTMPLFIFDETSPRTFTENCGSTTFTANFSSSGTSTAAVMFTVNGFPLAANSICAIGIRQGDGVRCPNAPQAANLEARTVAVSMATSNDIVTEPIHASTEIVGHGAYTTKIDLSPNFAGHNTSLLFTFAGSSKPMAVGDTITLLLPNFVFESLAVPTIANPSVCGNSSFALTASGSGTSSARLDFTITYSGMDAHRYCSITVSGGIRLPSTAEAADRITGELRAAGRLGDVEKAIDEATLVVQRRLPSPSFTGSRSWLSNYYRGVQWKPTSGPLIQLLSCRLAAHGRRAWRVSGGHKIILG